MRALAAQIARFGASTVFSAAMSFGIPVVLHEWMGVRESLGVAIGFGAAYLANIVLLRVFVFRSRGSWKRQLARYIPLNGCFRLAEYGAFLVLFKRVGLDYRVAMLVVLGSSSLIKFFAYRWIFHDRAERTPVP